MNRRDFPLHQVHPAILGTDIAAEVASWVLLWQRKPVAGLLVRLVPPIIASALVLRPDPAAEAGAQPDSAIKPSPAMGIRAAGDVLAAWGAWRRSPPMVLTGAAIVACGWSFAPGPRAQADSLEETSENAQAQPSPPANPPVSAPQDL
jgi:hypothetical protein